MTRFVISPIDIAVLLGYVLGVRLLFGWLVSRRLRGGGSEDYFLGGRRLTWPLIGLSFYVSNMSGSTFVALPGSAYHDGINAYNYEWMPALILVIFAVVIKLPNLFILILPGVMATTLYPDLDRPDLVFPTLAFDLLPVGLRGLILAALAAAILSSLESIYNSASTLFTFDFAARLRPGMTDAALVRTGRWATVGVMVLSALWAPQIVRFSTLWQYLQSVLSYLTPPVVAVFLLGMLWRRATATAALVTFAAMLPAATVGWALIEVAGLVDLQYLYASGVVFGASLIVTAGVSLATRPTEPERLDATVWRPALWRSDTVRLQGVAWYRNWRVQSAVLLAVTAAIVIWWW